MKQLVLSILAATVAFAASAQTIIDVGKPDANDSDLLRQSFITLQQTHSSATSQAILTTILEQRETLISSYTIPGLNYTFTEDGFTFNTTATYGATTPNCVGQPLDFNIVAAVNFGLRGYKFNGSGCVAFQVGTTNTAYFSVAHDPISGKTAYSIPGHDKIDIYNSSMVKIQTITGYRASTVEFDDQGYLWFQAHQGVWQQASLFKYSLSSGLVATYFAGQLAGGRGIAFNGNMMAVSDSFNHRVLMVDRSTMTVTHEITGMRFPNGVSFAANGDLIAADEHHNLVRRFDVNTWEEVWTSPDWQVLSPGYAVEITQGNYTGHLMISDADGNRIIVVDPDTWEIKREIGNIPSVLRAVPVY